MCFICSSRLFLFFPPSTGRSRNLCLVALSRLFDYPNGCRKLGLYLVGQGPAEPSNPDSLLQRLQSTCISLLFSPGRAVHSVIRPFLPEWSFLPCWTPSARALPPILPPPQSCRRRGLFFCDGVRKTFHQRPQSPALRFPKSHLYGV